MRKTDRKRATKAHQTLMQALENANVAAVEIGGTNAPILTVNRSENIRWNRALFTLEQDGNPILTDKTCEEIELFLNGIFWCSNTLGNTKIQDLAA